MTASRVELHDHLVAVLEAAQELPADHREHLVDGFLDELEAGYQLLSRSSGTATQDHGSSPLGTFIQQYRHWWPAMIAAALSLFVLVPALAWLVISGSSGAHEHHSFGILPFLVFLLLLRFFGPWRHRRRSRARF